MKMFVLIVSVVSVLFLTACGTTHRQSSANETKVVILAPSQADAELNKYEDDGWTLVGFVTGSPVSPTGELCGYLLKRPKNDRDF